MNLWLQLLFCSGPLVLCAISFGIHFYLSRGPLSVMMVALKQSPFIIQSAPALLAHGIKGRMLLVTRIWGMVIWPRTYTRSGDLDPEGLANFPPGLRRLLVIQTWLTFIIGPWLLVVYLTKPR